MLEIEDEVEQSNNTCLGSILKIVKKIDYLYFYLGRGSLVRQRSIIWPKLSLLRGILDTCIKM